MLYETELFTCVNLDMLTCSVLQLSHSSRGDRRCVLFIMLYSSICCLKTHTVTAAVWYSSRGLNSSVQRYTVMSVPLRVGTLHHYSWNGVWCMCMCCMKTRMWVGMLVRCVYCVCVCWETKLPNERWTRSHLTLSESLTAALKYCPDSHRRGEKRKSSPTETCALTWFNRRSSTSSKPELIPGLLMMQPPLRTDTGKLTWEAGRWVSVWPNTFLPSH